MIYILIKITAFFRFLTLFYVAFFKIKAFLCMSSITFSCVFIFSENQFTILLLSEKQQLFLLLRVYLLSLVLSSGPEDEDITVLECLSALEVENYDSTVLLNTLAYHKINTFFFILEFFNMFLDLEK